MSGVGIDLVSRSGEIKNLAAKEYLDNKSLVTTNLKKLMVPYLKV